jgi:hypothetical protein
MTTMTCHHCQKPVRRCDAALRSISLELAAFHPACLVAHMELHSAVDAVFDNAAPELSALVSLVGARKVA